METLEKSSGLQSRLLKQKRLAFQAKVIGHATPASKSRSSDLAGIANIATAGQTAEATALGVTLVVAPVDATGKFSVILDKAAIGDVQKVNKISAEVAGAPVTGVTAYISNGHICVDIDADANLTTDTVDCQIIVDYQKK